MFSKGGGGARVSTIRRRRFDVQIDEMLAAAKSEGSVVIGRNRIIAIIVLISAFNKCS